MKIQTFLITILLSSIAFSKSQEPELKQVFSKLRSSALVTFEVEKKTKSELLGSESKAPGTIFLSSDKFRWDTEGSESSKIIYDGKNIWTIQDPPKGFKAPPQITKMKLDKKSEGQIFLKSLFQEKYEKQFKLTKKTKEKEGWIFFLKPLQSTSGINEIQIKVDAKNEIKEFAYVDEVQNKTTVLVQKIKQSGSVDPKLFQYKPPTGASVNEL